MTPPPQHRTVGDRNSFVGCSLMEPELVSMRWFPRSVECYRWDWLLATNQTTQSTRPVSVIPRLPWLLIFFNNRNGTATGRRKNNGVLTNGTKIGLGWPFRSERKWRHRKTDVGWPPCQETNIPWEVSTDLMNKAQRWPFGFGDLVGYFLAKEHFL